MVSITRGALGVRRWYYITIDAVCGALLVFYLPAAHHIMRRG
jgi:hypothetical protein